ncbi:DNA-binding transcriptional activator of the SARP family [Actinacidiphila rubida]|uniref:DNA-binding transcriptional activator of the SARP family n=3 Tax=Actinacidiphila rubida TaxID=310780 RepID=A0A1H8JC13_9ACTN|nr:DNA-binding transcriptional activator of the SARP family [Actinacidiphila rubida]
MDRLVAALWGDLAPPGAGATIRTYVSRLRRALAGCGPAPVITSVGGGYALPAASGTSDLAEFERLLRAARDAGSAGDPATEVERLGAALALWKGTPLAGVRAEYAEHERIRLGQRRLTAVEECAAALLAVGRPAEAVPLLASVVVEEPLREQTRVLLMLALYRSGRQAEALGVYQEARQLLADELGLEPGPQLRRTQRRILASDPTLEGPHRPHPAAAPRTPSPSDRARRPDPADPAPAHPPTAAAPAAGPPGTHPPATPAAAPAPPLAARATLRPRQLPPDLRQFTGRSALVREMAEALRPGGSATSAAFVPVLGLTGPPGVGKTALAVHVGHTVVADFPDGQLFVDMGPGAGDGTGAPAVPAEVLGCLLRAVGVPDEAVPASGAERAALWRSVTTGRRLLLVLDGVTAAGHVQDVLPGPGGPAVLVTACRRLFGPAHARWTTVDVLSADDALALLATLVGTERIAAELRAARGLVDLTAGLPHALHALGARLASQPWRSLATARERLTGRAHAADVEPGECVALADRYDSVFRTLLPVQARALRLLALPDGPDLSLGAAAAALGLPPAEAEALLESLADVHLVEVGDGGRYRLLHPLRAYAGSRAPHDEGRAACAAALARFGAFHVAERPRPGGRS